MKNLIVILFVLFFLCFRKEMTASSEKEMLQVLPPVIVQHLPYWQTVIFEYSVEETSDGGITWIHSGKGRIEFDKKNNCYYEEFVAPVESGKTSSTHKEFFYKEGDLTEIGSAKVHAKNEKLSPLVQRRKRSSLRTVLRFSTNFLLTYNADNISQPIFSNGALIYPNAQIFKDTLAGKPVIRMFSEKIPEKNAPRKSTARRGFVFDVKTGLVLEKATYILVDGSEKLANKVELKDYFLCEGLYFPKTFLWHDSKRLNTRITIDKTTLHFNKEIPKERFIPTIPAGARVIDDINGTSYATPSLGNLEAEKKIVDGLDKLFEESKK